MWGKKIYPIFVCIILLPLIGDYLSDSLKFQKNLKRLFIWVCEYSWQELKQAKNPQRIYCMINGLQTRKHSYSVATAKTFKPCHYQLKSKDYTTKSEEKMRKKKQKWEEVGTLIPKSRNENQKWSPQKANTIVNKITLGKSYHGRWNGFWKV